MKQPTRWDNRLKLLRKLEKEISVPMYDESEPLVPVGGLSWL